MIDVDLIRSAPARLNRSGIGDVLSCHTGLWDWRCAVDRGHGAPWHDGAAALGRQLLDELDAHVDEIADVTPAAVRWLASAYQRIGAACSTLRHSRFEEGSEHFLAYALEHRTGKNPLHGELIAACVVAMSTLQANDMVRVRRIVERSGVTAHPSDLGLTQDEFIGALLVLPAYVRRESLDFSVIDTALLDERMAAHLWRTVSALPRR